MSSNIKLNQAKLETYLTSKYEFCYNEILNELMYKTIDGKKFKILNEFNMNSLLMELHRNNLGTSKKELTELLFSDFTKVVNVFKSYFDHLDRWDSQSEPDYIEQLSATVSVEPKYLQNWKEWFKKWIVAVAACAYDEKAINHTCLILVGGQGIGKTTWLEKLIPTALKDKYYYSGIIDPASKDTIIQLSECFLINMDELESLNRTDIGLLKEIITKTAVRVRRPYAAKSENMSRRASFMGSVNNNEFLKDPTGSRRFICFEVQEIEFQHNVNMDDVFAQAFYLYKTGYKFWFEGEEIKKLNTHNLNFKHISLEEEILRRFFMPCIATETPNQLMSTEQVIDYIYNCRGITDKLNPKKFGIALREAGFQRTKKNGLWIWKLNLVPEED
jgi:hypothetical protein